MNISTTTINGYENWITTVNGRNYTKSKKKMSEAQFKEWVESQLPKKPLSAIEIAEMEINDLLAEYTISENPIDIHNTKPQIYKGREYKFIEQKDNMMVWFWSDIMDSEHYGYDVFDSKLGRYPETYEIVSYGTLASAKWYLDNCSTIIPLPM